MGDGERQNSGQIGICSPKAQMKMATQSTHRINPAPPAWTTL
jgi:hypothetical protein